MRSIGLLIVIVIVIDNEDEGEDESGCIDLFSITLCTPRMERPLRFEAPHRRSLDGRSGTRRHRRAARTRHAPDYSITMLTHTKARSRAISKRRFA